MKTKYPRTIALTIAIVFGTIAISQAQIVCSIPCPVWNVDEIIKNTAINVLKEGINAIYDDQGEALTSMTNRLSKWTSLAHYLMTLDETPEWRIHDWWTEAVMFAKEYHRAMTYGDETGYGYGDVTVPRVDPVEILERLHPGPAQIIRDQLATIDIADSAIITGTDQTGKLRYNGRNEAQAIDDLNKDVTDESNDQSLTTVLDKVSAAGLIEVSDKQSRISLHSALLEQELVDSKRDRDDIALYVNGVINQLRDGQEFGQNTIRGTTTSLRNWNVVP